jgi:hypothetical protein
VSLLILVFRFLSRLEGGVHRLANPAYLSRFLFSGLLRVAPYCVPGGIRVVSILPSYMASTKGFVRCEGMNARRRVPSASPSCLPLPSSRRAGFRPLPLPGLGHIERHANEAVGSRAAVTQNACAGEDPTYAAPVGAGGIPARTSRSPPWPGAVCGRSTHGRRGGWSRIGSRGSRLDRQPEVAVAACGKLWIKTST